MKVLIYLTGGSHDKITYMCFYACYNAVSENARDISVDTCSNFVASPEKILTNCMFPMIPKFRKPVKFAIIFKA